MKNAFIAYQKNLISKTELYRFQELRKLLFKTDLFVIRDKVQNNDWREYERLLLKIDQQFTRRTSITEEFNVSDCCGAESWGDTDICGGCREHAEFELRAI